VKASMDHGELHHGPTCESYCQMHFQLSRRIDK
jgi:hypothetical protein